MKKYLFLLFSPALLVLITITSLYAAEFEQSGLQPIAPNGVFSTFSASSLEEGKVAGALTFEKASEPNFYRYSAHFAYGVTDTFEIGLSVPYVSEWQDKESGFEDIALGVKHRFFTEGKYGPSVAYMLEAGVIDGKDTFSTEGYVGAGIVISKRVGPVAGHMNFFWSVPGDSALEDQFVLSGGFDFSAAHNFKVLAELYARKSYYESEMDKIEARFGYRFHTSENFYTVVGVAFDLKDSTPEYRILLSFSTIYPKEKRTIRKVVEEAGQ